MIKMRTSPGGIGQHTHIALIDNHGNGLALGGKAPAARHTHEIVKFRVKTWNKHTHKLP